VIAVAVMLLISPGSARAAAGDLDSTFNNDGKAILSPVNAVPVGVLVQSDRRIVLAGSTARGEAGVWRLNPDGKPAVGRLSPGGALDTGFGSDGSTTIAFGLASLAGASALQSDGKLVDAGATQARRRRDAGATQVGVGTNLVVGTRSRDTLRGTRGDDKLSGGPGRDRLRGQRGRDRLTGGAGAIGAPATPARTAPTDACAGVPRRQTTETNEQGARDDQPRPAELPGVVLRVTAGGGPGGTGGVPLRGVHARRHGWARAGLRRRD
jgi:hypothetical protein